MSEEITETLSPEGAPKRANGSPGLVPVWTEGLPLPPVYLLTAQTTFLGRQAPQGNITVPQTTISRVHVSFTRSGDDVKLTDLKSHNGTFVNGVRVTEQVLADGDLIRMGDAVFKFIEDGAEAWATIRPGVRFVDQIGGVALQSIQEEIEAIGPPRFPVLIQGETGSGKEGVAPRAARGQSTHRSIPRDQLRRDPRAARRERVVRTSQRRVHRSQSRKPRALPRHQPRHVVAR
ncbi:MAG: hypothetical protein DI536_03485 [Archangium gephyra]|uniref:FHA domain-containing protein n=1 Tax=Archangium gephyra TaxID=48 RepID=A0A2W5TTR7_9BACT|nr:MAG: hypothetical protein DI536_03485 [Archangium gephyra]